MLKLPWVVFESLRNLFQKLGQPYSYTHSHISEVCRGRLVFNELLHSLKCFDIFPNLWIYLFRDPNFRKMLKNLLKALQVHLISLAVRFFGGHFRSLFIFWIMGCFMIQRLGNFFIFCWWSSSLFALFFWFFDGSRSLNKK